MFFWGLITHKSNNALIVLALLKQQIMIVQIQFYWYCSLHHYKSGRQGKLAP